MSRARKRRAHDDFDDNDDIVHPRLTGNDDDIAVSSDEIHGRDDTFETDYDKDFNGNSGRSGRKSADTSSKDGDGDDKEEKEKY